MRNNSRESGREKRAVTEMNCAGLADQIWQCDNVTGFIKKTTPKKLVNSALSQIM